MISNLITVYEHQILRLGKGFTNSHLKRMEEFYGDGGCPYFDLIHDGVKFREYVGVLQVGELTIEILPKTDKYGMNEDADKWRRVLIEMLRKGGILKVTTPSSADLTVKRNHILDLYFEIFLTETERILHEGLVKRYRNSVDNLYALKGRLNISKNVHLNAFHKERFLCEHKVYDVHHLLNKILYKTLLLIQKINTHHTLTSRICNLLLNFHDMEDVRVTESTFGKIKYDRKTSRYQSAISISELLLLNYHPDIKTGRKYVLALMFDMNLLWEKFVFSQLYPLTRKGLQIREQVSKHFWGSRNRRNIVPDIVVNRNEETFILDTKWKVIEDARPSMDDVQQMFAYNMLFNASKSILLYPKVSRSTIEAEPFVPKLNTGEDSFCQVAFIDVVKNGSLNRSIAEDVSILL